jgi:hypothetical protein
MMYEGMFCGSLTGEPTTHAQDNINKIDSGKMEKKQE